MDNTDIKKILATLSNHEKRILALEGKNIKLSDKTTNNPQKKITLSELIKGKKINSGQEKITIIIGYYEKILRLPSIQENDIKANWIKGKFDGKYRSNILERAIRDGLIRDLENGNFDLSQSGEKFFYAFQKQND